jgi:hypothetical protein
MQGIFGGRKGRDKRAGIREQASAVVFIELSDVIAIDPASHSSSLMPPL